MPKTAQYKCQNCKDLFTARTADRARGWARFCSKSCKASTQERKTHQFRNLQETGFSDAHLFDNTEK